jgi:hypothetical protein
VSVIKELEALSVLYINLRNQGTGNCEGRYVLSFSKVSVFVCSEHLGEVPVGI